MINNKLLPVVALVFATAMLPAAPPFSRPTVISPIGTTSPGRNETIVNKPLVITRPSSEVSVIQQRSGLPTVVSGDPTPPKRVDYTKPLPKAVESSTSAPAGLNPSFSSLRRVTPEVKPKTETAPVRRTAIPAITSSEVAAAGTVNGNRPLQPSEQSAISQPVVAAEAPTTPSPELESSSDAETAPAATPANVVETN